MVPVDFKVRIKLSQTRSKFASPLKTEIIRTATTPIPAASVIPEIPPYIDPRTTPITTIGATKPLPISQPIFALSVPNTKNINAIDIAV